MIAWYFSTMKNLQLWLEMVVGLYRIDICYRYRYWYSEYRYTWCVSQMEQWQFYFFFFFFFNEYLGNYCCPWVNIYEKKVIENHASENTLENRWFGNETIARWCNEIPGNVFVASLLRSELFDRSISTFMSRLSIPRYIVTPIQNIAVRIEKYRYSRYRLP